MLRNIEGRQKNFGYTQLENIDLTNVYDRTNTIDTSKIITIPSKSTNNKQYNRPLKKEISNRALSSQFDQVRLAKKIEKLRNLAIKCWSVKDSL